MKQVFYCYILFREDGTPFYVGKGHRNRWLDHEREAQRRLTHKDRLIAGMQDRGVPVRKIKVAEGLTNKEAAEVERLFIQVLGREPDGPLINQTAGGDGCVDPAPEVRERIRAKLKGRPIPPETRAKMKAVRKGRTFDPKFQVLGRVANLGKKRSAETRAKQSARKLGRPLSAEHRAKIGAAHRGKKASESTRERMRKPKSAAHRAAMVARWDRWRANKNKDLSG